MSDDDKLNWNLKSERASAPAASNMLPRMTNPLERVASVGGRWRGRCWDTLFGLSLEIKTKLRPEDVVESPEWPTLNERRQRRKHLLDNGRNSYFMLLFITNFGYLHLYFIQFMVGLQNNNGMRPQRTSHFKSQSQENEFFYLIKYYGFV